MSGPDAISFSGHAPAAFGHHSSDFSKLQSQINALASRVGLVEQKNTAQDAKIAALEQRVAVLEAATLPPQTSITADVLVATAPGARRGHDALSLNGDTLTDLDISAVIADHRRSGALVTLALVPNTEPEKYSGIVVGDDDGAHGRNLSV